jgi:hypothetical protein
MDRLEHIICKINRANTAHQKKVRSMNNMETKILHRHIPPRGLHDLQQAVESKVPKIMEYQNMSYINKEQYNFFMNWFFAALYVFGVNGRKSGINILYIRIFVVNIVF